jgi:hypothetical protein
VSLLEQATGRRRTRTSRRRLRRAVVFALLAVVVFLLGMAFARALDDAPKHGQITTVVRTLTPLPQQAPARTVTVTVSRP